jgi:hypothetical protein
MLLVIHFDGAMLGDCVIRLVAMRPFGRRTKETGKHDTMSKLVNNVHRHTLTLCKAISAHCVQPNKASDVRTPAKVGAKKKSSSDGCGGFFAAILWLMVRCCQRGCCELPARPSHHIQASGYREKRCAKHPNTVSI